MGWNPVKASSGNIHNFNKINYRALKYVRRNQHINTIKNYVLVRVIIKLGTM